MIASPILSLTVVLTLIVGEGAAFVFRQHQLSLPRNSHPEYKSALIDSRFPGYRRGTTGPRQSSLTSFIDGLFNSNQQSVKSKATISPSIGTVQGFIGGLNNGNIENAIENIAEDGTFEFASFSKPCEGRKSLERLLRLMKGAEGADGKMVVVDRIVSDDRAVALRFHLENLNGECVPAGRGSAFFVMNDSGDLIKDVFWVQESTEKPGEDSLKLLGQASIILEKTGSKSRSAVVEPSLRANSPVAYFEAWNRRDMGAAVSVFADDVTYDDTAFPVPFEGKEKLEKHLLLCADCFPKSFSFKVDDCLDAGDAVCVKWHVENNGQQLPFTRGCSFYEINKQGKIQDGIDFVEPAVFKKGGLELVVDTVKAQITQEPARIAPLVVWALYIVIVFFSDGIIPGANALQLEQRTWEEVRDLSLNFFLVSPILGLPFAPIVHPMLEGVFNLLLSWAAMFAGFLSDDRKDKPNLLPMFPMVVGMQALTSAFLLPYLAFRSTETCSNDVSKSDLSVVGQACESPVLGGLMGAVGSLSIGWAFLGRQGDFGDLPVRWASFQELLSIDRVGCSFLVDLAIFGLFQFWLVDDDLKRRGVEDTSSPLALAAKYVPFFGMATYLMFRPQFQDSVSITPGL
mmetsp:Transcript_2791/g.3751  ORF Transcript_2791/g.3751 Transcript_2791/m.3751 type:complete len:628 (+) Transcript_2791:104-1987(+)